MKKKILAVLITISILSFLITLCSVVKTNSEPVVTEAVQADASFNGGIHEEIEIVNEPMKVEFREGELERIREKESEIFNESVDLYIEMSQRTQPCGYALTPPEIYRLKQNVTAEQLEVIELFESAINGKLKSPVKVVGSPYDTTWRRLHDSEVEMLLEQSESGYDPYDDNNSFALFNWEAAEAESKKGFWYGLWKNTIYFDFYAFYKKVHGPGPEFGYFLTYY